MLTNEISVNDLTEGSHQIAVQDKLGCTDNISITIDAPASALTVDTLPGSVNNVVCKGSNTAALEILTEGGWGNYTYSLNDAPYSTEKAFSELLAGTYEIKAIDGNGCQDSTEIVISEPALALNLDSIPASVADSICYGTSAGAVSVMAEGGWGNYSYAINDGLPETATEFTGLTAAVYEFKVIDASGCVDSFDLEIHQPAAVLSIDTLDGSIQEILCRDQTNGAFEVLAEGGWEAYTFSVNDTVEGSQTMFKNLSAASYNIAVNDKIGCTDNMIIELTNPTAVTLVEDSESHADNLCYGDQSGQFKVSASGGTEVFEYSIDGINFSAESTFINLAAGEYEIIAHDQNNCSQTIPVSIHEPEKLIVSEMTENHTDNLCYGDASGVIEVSAGGGTSPFTFSIDGESFDAETSFNSLSEGDYTIIVRDAENCTDTTETISIIDPQELLITDESVSGDTISVTAEGGTGSPEYSLNGGTAQSEGFFTDLDNGDYVVNVEDANGCTAVSGTLTVDVQQSVFNINSIAKHVNAYPNPNKGIFTLEIEAAQNVEKLSIISVFGKTVYTEEFDHAVRYIEKEIDLSNYEPGTYLLMLNNRSTDFKLIIGSK